MNKEFLIYDLETFGLNDIVLIAQFAARRYSSDFEPLDDGIILYCKLPEDYLPSLESCLVTGITPQFTNEKGLCELEFARQVQSILLNNRFNTIIAGYNNSSFDNDVINKLFFRNLMNPYTPFVNRSVDCFTLARAIHYLDKNKIKYISTTNSEGIKQDSLKLENLTKANNLTHSKAHDALSDVEATAAVMKLIKQSNERIYAKYLSNVKKDVPMEFVRSCIATKKPIMLITRSNKENYATVIYIIANDSNRYYGINLLLPDDDFNEGIEFLNSIQYLDNEEYISNLYNSKICTSFKINEPPYIDYCDEYYNFREDKKEIENLIKERIKIIEKKLQKDFISVNSYKKNQNTSKDNKAEEKEVEETILEGFISEEGEETRALMEIAANGTSENLKRKLSELGKGKYSDRVEKLYSHMIGRNHPEIYSPKAISRWNEYVKNRLNKQKDSFVNEYDRLIKSDLDDKKKKIIEDVVNYEKGIFDKFSLRLF